MPVHYLRVEAVNLGNSVYDTEDLSTIRGSGLMILKLQGPVVEAIRQSTASGIPLVKASECVSHGASQVVFRVELIPGAKADDLVKAVSDFLRKDAQLKFATLVVSISDRVYDSAREALLANNRFRQLRYCTNCASRR